MSASSSVDPSAQCPTDRPTSAPLAPATVPAGQHPDRAIYRRERLRTRGPGVVGLNALLANLSPRDISLLQLISEHRFMTAAQVEAFIFFDHASPDSGARTSRRVLARLERDGLLERPIRRVGGLQAGSASSIWMLTSTGQRLLNLRAGRGAIGRVRPPGERFVAHYLAIAVTHLALVGAERAGRLIVTQLQIEPASWRRYVGLGGSRETLKPDLYAVTAVGHNAEYEDHWFIEVDRGTESIPTLLKQCAAYETYRRTGLQQQASEVFPVVVWIVPDQRRAERLAVAIAARRGLDAALYRVTTTDDFVDVVTHPEVGAAV